MTVSTHVYSAFLIGDPDVELDVRGGSLSLDAGAAPHVEGTIEIAPPGAATLDALDPRFTPRIRVEANATFPGAEQSRTFDLALRDRSVSHADARVSITLASDEALLNDYAPLADDRTPRDYEASARSLVNYVLGVAIPGAELDPDGPDADLTAYWALTNLVPNPSVVGALGSFYVSGSGTSAVDYSTAVDGWVGPSCVRWTASTAGSSQVSARQYTAQAGQIYTASAYVRQGNGRNVRIRFHWRDSENELISTSLGDVVTGTDSWADNTRPTLTATAPEGTARVGLLVERVSGGIGEYTYADAFMLYEGDEVVPYFDGSTITAGYVSTWSDVSHASQSTRVPILERDPQSQIWTAGTSALEFLAPLVQSVGLRLVCDEARVWTLRDEEYRAAGSLSIRHGVNLTDATETISRDSGLHFDAAVARYTWTHAGVEHERIDAYGEEGYTRLRVFDITTPYPGPGFAQYAVRRAQGRGREVTASSVADWRSHAEQAMTIVLDGTPILTGISQRVNYDLDRDEQTVTMRGVDTPPTAWVLGPEALTWDDAAAVAWDDVEDWSDL